MAEHIWQPRTDGRTGYRCERCFCVSASPHQHAPCEGEDTRSMSVGVTPIDLLDRYAQMIDETAKHLGCTPDKIVEAAEKASAVLGALNRLREPEGASVTINCPNYDFGGPNESIEVSDDWTGPNWEPKRFTGETLAECLKAAEKAKRESLPTLLDCCGILPQDPKAREGKS